MAIEHVTLNGHTILRFRRDDSEEIDFDGVVEEVHRFLQSKENGSLVLSLPDAFAPAGSQLGFLIVWGEKLRSRGGNLTIISRNPRFRETAENLGFAFKMCVHDSEEQLSADTL
jgi:hypothetical protein